MSGPRSFFVAVLGCCGICGTVLGGLMIHEGLGVMVFCFWLCATAKAHYK